MIKISKFLLLASISTLFIEGIPIFGPFKISGYLLILSFLFFTIAIIKKQIDISFERKSMFYILIFIGTILLGGIISILFLKNISIISIIKGFFYILVNLYIFIEILIVSNNDKSFPKKVLLCFLFSFIIIPLIYIPTISKYFLYDGKRFEGLFSDPNYFVNFQIIPTILILFYIIKDNTKIILKIILTILFFFSIGLILWSGSRSGIMGLLISLIILIIFLVNNISKKKLTALFFLIMISFPIGYLIIPRISHENIESRIDNIQIQPKQTDTANKISLNLTSGQDRLNIWKNALFFIIKNPLGYGPEYNNIINIKGDNTEHRVSHNLELQILLTGGIGLFILINWILLLLIIKSIKNCYKQKFSEIHILLPILIGLLASGMFLDSLFLRWIWIILALIIVYNRKISSNKILD